MGSGPLQCCGYVSLRKLSKHDRAFLLEESTTELSGTFFTEQQIAIRTLSASIAKFQQIYDYYQECCQLEKARAVLYEIEKKNHQLAMVHVAAVQKYEQAMEVVASFQTKFIQVKIELQLLNNTTEAIKLLQDYSTVLEKQLHTIYNKFNITKTLTVLETQMNRIQDMEGLINATAETMNPTQEMESTLNGWCKKSTPILETISSRIPGAELHNLHSYLPILESPSSSLSSILPTNMAQSIQGLINTIGETLSYKNVVPNQTEEQEQLVL